MAQAVSLGAWGDKKAWKNVENQIKSIKKARDLKWKEPVMPSESSSDGGSNADSSGTNRGSDKKTTKAPPHVIRKQGFGYNEVRVKIRRGKMDEVPGRVEPLGGPPDKQE